MPTSPLLPLFLDLRDRPVLLVGGGSVGLAKLEALLPTGARLRLVATRFSRPFRAKARAHGLDLQERPFEAADLDGARLVVSATNEPATNAFIAAAARARGVWVNAVDDPSACDVQFASTLRRGPCTLALSTAGSFPGLSRSLRRALDELLPASDEGLLQQLAQLRARLRARLPDPAARTEALRALLDRFEHDYLALTGDAP